MCVHNCNQCLSNVQLYKLLSWECHKCHSSDDYRQLCSSQLIFSLYDHKSIIANCVFMKPHSHAYTHVHVRTPHTHDDIMCTGKEAYTALLYSPVSFPEQLPRTYHVIFSISLSHPVFIKVQNYYVKILGVC